MARIEIQFIPQAAQARRGDWAIAKVTIHSPLGTYGGHTIHDHAGRGRLKVEAARGSFLHGETKAQILAEYHRLINRDRYWEDREAYGIWDVAACSDGRAPDGPKEYMIHRVRDGQSTYSRVTAPDIRRALAAAGAEDSPEFYSYGIMAADYPEAQQAGISFFEGDGLLI